MVACNKAAGTFGRDHHPHAFSIWMAQPKNCYDESVTPREPQRYHAVFFSRPLLPHSETTVVYSGRPSFLRPDLPLLDLTRHAPTPTVGYVHVQVAIETVGIEGKTWRRKQVRDGKPLPPYDPDLYEIDRPDCSAWQAVVPRLRSMGGADISLKEPHVLERAGAGIPQSSESAYFFTCAYVQKADGSAFICPNLSAPPRGHSGKR